MNHKDSWSAWDVYAPLKHKAYHSQSDLQSYIDTLSAIQPSWGQEEVDGLQSAIAVLQELKASAIGDGIVSKAEVLPALVALYYL